MGGTASLLLALSKPKLVKKLILIDPVILPLRYIISYKLLQIVNLAHLASPLSKNALIRRNFGIAKLKLINIFLVSLFLKISVKR